MVEAMPLDLYTPRFTFEDAAKACGRPVGTVRSWKNSDLLKFEHYDQAGRPGKAGLMALATVYRIALAAELIGYGLAPKDAFYAASAFTDVSNYELQDYGDKEAPRGRSPGELFPNGETLLIVWRPAGELDDTPDLVRPNRLATVVNVKMDDKYGAALSQQFYSNSGGRSPQFSFIIVECNFICRHVNSKLGVI